MIMGELAGMTLVGRAECLWRYTVQATGARLDIAPPTFEVDGRAVTATVVAWDDATPSRTLGNGIAECRFAGTVADDQGLSLELVLRFSESPILRFRYALRSKTARRLTKTSGRDNLTYLRASFAGLPQVTEVRVAEFNEMVHSYCLSEREIAPRHFDDGMIVMGPILVGSDGAHSRLLAYEHGSQVPDAFLHYELRPDRNVALRAVKGNYWDGQVIDVEHPYETLWLQAAVVAGDTDALAAAYRDFVLRHQTLNAASRRPYIFYNTWNFQERNKWWNGKAYLDSMTQERMLAEIDVAHRIGVDVFVLDTGWYEKTGDWRVSRARFPDGLKAARERLDGYGMKLGLWFNPTVAAVSSQMRRDHEDCVMSWRGKPHDPHEVWETEASQGLCLVSRYWEAFADELIRLTRQVGVTYFKWDAVGQYGCDDPHHGHGTPENSIQERADCYAFQQGAAMARVVDRLCAACPEAIVDFDVTEGGRTVGLGFLSAGKYFLINNGPYSSNYDMPVPRDGNVNLFFYPGPARAWVCRAPLTYDKWLPSVLFLTHYLPDDRYPKHGWSGSSDVQDDTNQWISLASLVLGQNGLWGDLLNISDAGIARFGETLRRYKKIRDDIAAAALTRTGAVGGSPEIYEKINPATGRGVVSAFASATGRYTYVTAAPVAHGLWHNDGVTVTVDAQGRTVLDMTFDGAGAKLVFFGVSS